MSEAAERFGIWKAWKGLCAWCREPVLFKNCDKEHLIPRDAENNLADLIKRFGLPSDFEIESFENWVPSCSSCNKQKGTRLVDPAPLISVVFVTARHHAPLAREISKTIDSEPKKARTLARLGATVETQQLTKEEILEFLSGLPCLIQKAAAPPQEILHIAPAWDVVESGGRVIEVRDISAGTHVSSVHTTIVGEP